MTSSLSAGAINRMLKDEDVPNPVIQILSLKRIAIGDEDNIRYRLMISDGVTSHPFVTMDTDLNKLIVNKELEQFAVVKVHDYGIQEVDGDDRVIIILFKLTIVTPGKDIGKKLGNPTKHVYKKTSSTTTSSKQCSNVTESIGIPLAQPNKTASASSAQPDETASVSSVKPNETASVSSGQLNETASASSAPTNETASISSVKPNKTVSIPSAQPFLQSNKDPASKIWPESENGIIPVMEMVKFLNLERYTMVPNLSAGSINNILNEEKVPDAVMQVLGCKKIPGAGGNVRYCLTISDGITSFPFAILGTQFGQIVESKELDQFCVIRVEKYNCHYSQDDRKVVVLLRLTVLVPGDEVNKRLGNPINYSAVTSPKPVPS